MKKSRDKIAHRLAWILTRFNEGARFSTEELAEEFNVDKRTIQRDLNERFSYLPIKKEHGYYALEVYALGKLGFEDIKNFAAISGIKSLYPSLSDRFITEILDSKLNTPYLVKTFDYENLEPKKNDFDLLSAAIIDSKQIACVYNAKQRTLKPYKFVNNQGIWYLVADENGILKNYAFTKMSHIKVLDKSFIPDRSIVKSLHKNEVTWFSQKEIEVTLSIDVGVAEYFLRRNLFPNQRILDQTDTSLLLSTKISYDDEILNIVKYWIPHIKIITPHYLQDKLNTLLTDYLKTT